jgi:hypothetical protein
VAVGCATLEVVQFWCSGPPAVGRRIGMPPPTRRQLAALGACLNADDGSTKAAAHDFGVSYVAMRSLLHRLYRDLGVTTQAQAVAVLDKRFPRWRATR